MTSHTRWGRWPVKGAYGPTGGHMKLPFFSYSWTASGIDWEFEFFRLFAIRWYYNRIQWAFGTFTLKLNRASWRYFEREQNIQRQRARREHAKRSLPS